VLGLMHVFVREGTKEHAIARQSIVEVTRLRTEARDILFPCLLKLGYAPELLLGSAAYRTLLRQFPI
jgi:hypothetical protein